jgi:transcriptional regulator with XRE-family HTH domain
MPIGPDQAARRIRAAIAYSGLPNREIARRAGLSPSTLERMASKTSPRGATLDELDAIAGATGMPRAFLRHGPIETDLLTYRVTAIEAFLTRWINDDPALFAAPLPGVDDLPPDPGASTPIPEDEPVPSGRSGRRRAAGRRRVA